MLTTLIIALTTYVCMLLSTRYRTTFAVIGSGTLLIYGSLSKSFPASLAFQKFPSEIVILIIVLALFTKVFENNGFFTYIGNRFVNFTKGKRILIVMLLPFVIYATSLFMNNLSVILLFTFICLELSVRFKLPIIPILVSAIIASNIGGAPLPWADTPAVILTLYTDFTLLDFITKLFLPCAVYTGLLILYTRAWFIKLDRRQDSTKDEAEMEASSISNIHPKPLPPPPPHPGIPIPPHLHPGPHRPPHEGPLHHPPMPPVPPHVMHERESEANKTKANRKPAYLNKVTNYINSKLEIFSEKHPNFSWKKINVPMILFIMLIGSICVAPFLDISIAYVSLFFGGLVLISKKTKPEDVINSLPILDSLVFIIALFLIAGALEYSGILKALVDYILTFTGESKLLIVLCIMFSAFIIATFLSAGPAAATLLPVCQQLSPMIGSRLVYAALALGILAGSSMLPWSATGGPVMLSEVNRFLKSRHDQNKYYDKIKQVFDLKSYAAFSIPFSLIILVLSGVFLAIYLVVI